MDRFLELLRDQQSVAGVAVTTAVIVAAAVLLRLTLVPLVRRRFRDDPYRRYWAGKLTGYVLAALAVVALVVVWAPLGGRLSVVLGFATAGIAFAMQEVIGALFGWVNVVGGRIYTVGDRVEIGGVRGDVIDITPLRTMLMEIGSGAPGDRPATAVTARQPTGRIVALSNKKTFTDPVFNYSAEFDWLWDELSFAVPYEADWRRAEAIVAEAARTLDEDVRRHGEEVLERMARRYVLSRADIEAATYVQAQESWIEITVRFITRVRTARAAKDAVTRTVLERFEAEGIPNAYPRYAIVPHPPSDAGRT